MTSLVVEFDYRRDLVRDVLAKVQCWPEDLQRPDVQILIAAMPRYERHILGVAFLNKFGGAL